MSLRTQKHSIPLMTLTFKEYAAILGWYEYYRDDFDDGALGPEWTTHALTANTTITEAGGIATIEIKNNADGRWWCTLANKAPKMYMPMSAVSLPARITTKLNRQDGDPDVLNASINDDTAAGIFIGTGPTLLGGSTSRHAWMWARFRDDSAGYDGIRVFYNCGTRDANLDCSSGCLPKYLRINISETGTISFWWSSDDTTYTQFTHLGSPFFISGYNISNSYVGLFAKNIGGNENTAAEFEYFLIEEYRSEAPTFQRRIAPIDVRSPDRFYDGRIKSMSSLKRAVDDTTGLFQIADLSVVLANHDREYSKLMLTNILKNQEVTVEHAWTDEPETSKSHLITMIVEDHFMRGPDFTIKLKDITQKYFTKKLPENICTEDEFTNIHPDHVGRYMPVILGNAFLQPPAEHPGAVEAVYVDTVAYRYIAAQGTLNAITQVYADDVLKSTPGDYSVVYAGGYTWIDFVADQGDATIAFNAQGYSVPAWDSANGYIQNLAYIIQYFLQYLMEIPSSLIDGASFATLAAYYVDLGVDESGYLIIQDEVDGMELLRELLFTGGAKGFMAKDGKFDVERKDLTNWDITSLDQYLFDQVDLFGSAQRKWNLTKAVNTVKARFGFIPWQRLFTGAKDEYRDNFFERPMEDHIRSEIRTRRTR